MPRKLLHTVAAVALTSLAMAPISVGVSLLTTDAAYAKPGNGKGQGQAKGQENRQERAGSTSNRGQAGAPGQAKGQAKGQAQERKAWGQLSASFGAANWGEIASELGPLNKAHASPNARLNSSDPTHALLNTYAGTDGISAAGVTAYNTAVKAKKAYDAYVQSLAEETVEVDGVEVPVETDSFEVWADANGYAGLTTDDVNTYLGYADAYGALAALTEGPLTAGAIDALNALLGLEAPATP